MLMASAPTPAENPMTPASPMMIKPRMSQRTTSVLWNIMVTRLEILSSMAWCVQMAARMLPERERDKG